jgi:hypothetical protein
MPGLAGSGSDSGLGLGLELSRRYRKNSSVTRMKLGIKNAIDHFM